MKHPTFLYTQSILLLTILSAWCFQNTFAQSYQNNFNISWLESKKTSIQNEVISVPNFENIEFNSRIPIFAINEKVNLSNAIKPSISDVVYENPNSDEINYFKKLNIPVSDTISHHFYISKSKNSYRLVGEIQPFVRVNSTLQKISSFTLKIQNSEVQGNATIFKKDFVANSILSNNSDKWYKIAIPQDGIYKIDKAFLDNNGIQTSQLNPKKINIYGNGFGKLPENNADFRPDDLIKNAIQVYGEQDGSFDAGDYILFYAWGPHRWAFENQRYTRQINNYANFSYYYIQISDQEQPLRINQASPITSSATIQVTDYDYYDVYEKEIVNLFQSGQRWYGELFDTQLSQNFGFNIPNINNQSPIKIRTDFAVKKGSGQSKIRVTANNVQVLNENLETSFIYTSYGTTSKYFEVPNPSAALNLNLSITRDNAQITTYLDKIEINARRNLVLSPSQFSFRDRNSVAPNNIAEYTINNASSTSFVWNISHRQTPQLVSSSLNGTNLQFKAHADTIHEYVVANGTNYLTPQFVGVVESQNLHGLGPANYLVVTPKEFLAQANRLANLHRDNGTTVHVATTEQIYNEFSSGSQDPTAIRWFAKMFYDRANGDITKTPENLLIFGAGSYDNRGIYTSTNYIPTYQTLFSEDEIESLVSDDYFVMLDDNEYFSDVSGLDMGVGRLLITSEKVAREQVDKIEIYIKNGLNISSSNGSSSCCGDEQNAVNYGSFGDWKLNYVQITDDEENGHFIKYDAEPQNNIVKGVYPEMNPDKLYTDAFTQITTAGGQRYPSVNEAINNNVANGSILLNYIGHGGIAGAMHERVITISQIEAWSNLSKLNLFITASCEFTKFDDHAISSAGEKMILNSKGGSIALMTTTRPVWIGVNTNVGIKLFTHLFQRDANYKPLTFGEIMRRTKNETASSGSNRRCFSLIGDPQLGLALPQLRVKTDSINGLSPTLVQDTILGLSKMTIKGHVEDHLGNAINDYNGLVNLTIFDKPKNVKTLGQDPYSPIIDFKTQQNKIFKGKATVKNGQFELSFIIPKDIDLSFGNGKIQYYLYNEYKDGAGQDQNFVVGGLNVNGMNDKTGPTVDLFLNDENFVSGGLTDETPKLVAKVFDDSGINTVGNGIGHDIVAILDDNTSEPILLNNFYEADLDTYQSGKIQYTFNKLAPGRHNLKLKVWDVNNNPTEVKIDFVVQEKRELALDHVLNYPNPFTTRTEFYFEHNQVCNFLETQIEIFTVSGRLVKTINQLVRTQGFRSEGIEWNGLDDFGDQLAKGVYIYRLSVKNPDGDKAQKLEKLVLLR